MVWGWRGAQEVPRSRRLESRGEQEPVTLEIEPIPDDNAGIVAAVQRQQDGQHTANWEPRAGCFWNGQACTSVQGP